ncbi:MAG: TPMT family class I SAM-dependent methyltransferase, partial [Chitinophagales bacterium]|nr:TPMT family class I SAM-dependent methyltransferase [Chitinophagales bacterium]
NIYVVDWAQSALQNLLKRVPTFPKNHLLKTDFFKINESFDLIVEQTFFCALTPNLRQEYVNKMYELLNKNGKLVGLLFNIPLNTDHPPYGGNKEEYVDLFSEKFKIKTMQTAYNSIKPRMGNELFFIAQKG